jgi:hypothetical protein
MVFDRRYDSRRPDTSSRISAELRFRPLLIQINWRNHKPNDIDFAMSALLFTCPVTGYRVQGWVDKAAAPGGEAPQFAATSCPACGRTHLIELVPNPPNLPDGSDGSGAN